MHKNDQKSAETAPAGGDLEGCARIGPDGVSWKTRPQGHRGERVLVPGDYVRLLLVELPLRDARARARALPYAVEPAIAQPLDTQHTAIGPRLEENSYLAAVIDRDWMQRWTEMLEEAGAPHAALVPEPCALKIAEKGVWTIYREHERVIVRKPDGTGFSASDVVFHLVHEAAGKPGLSKADEGLRTQLSGVAQLDLRQGLFASRQTASMPGLKTAASILAAGAGLHLAIAFTDLALIEAVAASREREAIRILDQAGIEAGRDPAATIIAALPSAQPARSTLFAMLKQTAGALNEQDGLNVRALRFRDAVPELSLDFQTGDLSGLQAAERALSGAGLATSSGTASAGDGFAEATIVIQQGSAP
ncbi:MAG: type II secretion system protein GspL [Pararhodobacter sp.]